MFEVNIKCGVWFSFTPQVPLRVLFVLRVDQLLTRDVWKFSTKEDGERCAIADSTQPQLKLFATALDIQGNKLHVYLYHKRLTKCYNFT